MAAISRFFHYKHCVILSKFSVVYFVEQSDTSTVEVMSTVGFDVSVRVQNELVT